MTDARANIDGFTIPLHRALTEPILLAGAPRTVAIINGTLAAAVGLGLRLWVPGLLLWLIGHSIAVAVAKRDPRFLEALVRHVRHKAYLSC